MSLRPSGSGRTRNGRRLIRCQFTSRQFISRQFTSRQFTSNRLFSSRRSSNSRLRSNRLRSNRSLRFIGSGLVQNRYRSLARDIATCARATRWLAVRCRHRIGCRSRLAASLSNGRKTGRRDRPIRRVRRPIATVRLATGTVPRLGASIPPDIRLGAATRHVTGTGRRLATSGRVRPTGRAIVVTGRPATATRIGTDQAVVTGQATGLATDTGPILATVQPITATSPVTGTLQGLVQVGMDHRLATVPVMALRVTVRAAMARAAMGLDPTDTAMAAATVRHRRLVSTVRPLIAVTVGVRRGIRQEPMGTVRHQQVATTTGLRLRLRLRRSTAAMAINSGRVTTRAAIRAAIRRDPATAGAGQAGAVPVQVLDLTAGCRRVGRTGGGQPIQPLAGRTSGRPIR
jgi:hypothetical protein